MRGVIVGFGLLAFLAGTAACGLTTDRAGVVADRVSPGELTTSSDSPTTPVPADTAPGEEAPRSTDDAEATSADDAEDAAEGDEPTDWAGEPESAPATDSDTVPSDESGRRSPELGGIDELFPDLGSPDVDVASYDVELDLTGLLDPDLDDSKAGDPAAGDRSSGGSRLADPGPSAAVTEPSYTGRVTIRAEVPLDVSGLALDAEGLEILAATVDGEPVEVVVGPTDLVLPLPVDRAVTVTAVVEYSGILRSVASDSGLPVGWHHEGDSAHVLDQPDGARIWLPSNDHPSDKAEWRFEVVAPDELTVSANGALVEEGGKGEPWIWQGKEQMATYLVHLVIGDFDLVERSATIERGSLPLTHVVPRGTAREFGAALSSVEPQIRYLESVFGPYPLEEYGLAFAGLVENLAMETQGRTLLDRDFLGGLPGAWEEIVLAHELAHQWFGNAVTPATWGDIWLSESFATYGQWLWFDHQGLQTIESSAGTALANRQTSGPPTGRPDVSEMFGYNSYDGGAAVLHALRLTMGDEPFFALLRRWVEDNTGTSRSTEDFIALASEVHGADLTEFFDTWLYAPRLPPHYP